MVIDDKMIDYIGELARLRLKDEERENAKNEMNKIIDYMDILNQLDTTGIEAMSHAFPVKNVFREDILEPSKDRQDILFNAPNKKDGAFKVPKTFE